MDNMLMDLDDGFPKFDDIEIDIPLTPNILLLRMKSRRKESYHSIPDILYKSPFKYDLTFHATNVCGRTLDICFKTEDGEHVDATFHGTDMEIIGGTCVINTRFYLSECSHNRKKKKFYMVICCDNQPIYISNGFMVYARKIKQ